MTKLSGIKHLLGKNKRTSDCYGSTVKARLNIRLLLIFYARPKVNDETRANDTKLKKPKRRVSAEHKHYRALFLHTVYRERGELLRSPLQDLVLL